MCSVAGSSRWRLESVIKVDWLEIVREVRCRNVGGIEDILPPFVVGDGVDDTREVLPVLPNPPFLVVLGRCDSRRMAGVAAFSKISCAILSPDLIVNLSCPEFTRSTLTSSL